MLASAIGQTTSPHPQALARALVQGQRHVLHSIGNVTQYGPDVQSSRDAAWINSMAVLGKLNTCSRRHKWSRHQDYKMTLEARPAATHHDVCHVIVGQELCTIHRAALHQPARQTRREQVGRSMWAAAVHSASSRKTRRQVQASQQASQGTATPQISK